MNGTTGVGPILQSLKPGNGLDSLRTFMDRLSVSQSSAVSAILTGGFATPPVAPTDATTSLTVGTPSASFNLKPQGALPSDATKYQVVEGGSAFFKFFEDAALTTPMNSGNFTIRIQHINAADFPNLAVRLIGSMGADLSFQLSMLDTKNPTTGTYTIAIDWASGVQAGEALSYLTLYNTGKARTMSGIDITITR
jgi:hypothetical protein